VSGNTGGSGGADAEEVLSAVGRSWIWALAGSLVTLAAGIMVLAWPEETARVFAIVIGVQFIAVGVVRLVMAIGSEHSRHGAGVLPVIFSLLSILAGVLCLRHQLQTVTVLALIVGALWLIGGVLMIYTSISERSTPHRGARVAIGGLTLVAGILVLGYPTESVIALARLIGLWLILLGLFDLGVVIAVRVAGHRTSEVLRESTA